MKRCIIALLLCASLHAQDLVGLNPRAIRPARPSPGVSMQASDWELYGSAFVPRHPEQLGGGWQFIFPSYDDSIIPCYANPDCQGIGSADAAYSSSISVGKAFTMSFILTGNPTFGYATQAENVCVSPATARFFIEQRVNGSDPNLHRWYSNPASVVLSGGTWAISAPVDPSQWSSLYGDFGNSSPAAYKGFLSTLKNPDRVGIVFGGGCFFGHAAYQNNPADGASLFQMLSYSIQ